MIADDIVLLDLWDRAVQRGPGGENKSSLPGNSLFIKSLPLCRVEAKKKRWNGRAPTGKRDAAELPRPGQEQFFDDVLNDSGNAGSLSFILWRPTLPPWPSAPF